jgi:hypothetical protein
VAGVDFDPVLLRQLVVTVRQCSLGRADAAFLGSDLRGGKASRSATRI